MFGSKAVLKLSQDKFFVWSILVRLECLRWKGLRTSSFNSLSLREQERAKIQALADSPPCTAILWGVSWLQNTEEFAQEDARLRLPELSGRLGPGASCRSLGLLLRLPSWVPE